MWPCQGAYAHGEACCSDEDRAGIGAYCPIHSMVREPYDCIIGEAPIGAIPLGRVATARGSLRRHAYTAMVEGMMSRRQSSAKREGLSQLNLTRRASTWGHQPLCGGSRRPRGAAGA